MTAILPTLGAAIYLTIAFVLFFLGIVTYRQAGQVRVSRFAAWMILFAALGAFNAGIGLLIEVQYGEIPVVLHRLGSIWELFFPTLLALSLQYPSEHVLYTRLPRLVYWLYLPYVFHLLVIWLAPESLEFGIGTMDWARGILLPLRILVALATGGAEALVRFHAGSFVLVDLVFAVAALFFIARGYAATQDLRIRQEGNLVLLGLMLSVGTYALAFLVPRLLPFRLSPWIAHGFLLSALVFGASALAWAIIRYQFLGVRMILRGGVVFSLSVGLIAGVYLLAYRQVQRLTTAALGHTGPALELLFLMVAIFLFQPLAHLLESGIERLFARELADARVVLQRTGEEVLSILDPDELENRLQASLEGELGLGSVRLWLEEPDGGTLRRVSGSSAEPLEPEVSHTVRQLSVPVLAGDVLREGGGKSLPAEWTESTLLVPVRYRETFLGLIEVQPALGRSFAAEEVGLLATLAGHVGVALESGRLHRQILDRRRVEEELAIARDIQKQLLPAASPNLPRLEVAALNLPSREVGGDVYDFVVYTEDRLGIALGDVAGKGVPAALLMANLQAAFRVLADEKRSPSEVVGRLNRQLARSTAADRYATFLFGVLDAHRGRFTYANAGHNYPILRTPNGEVRTLAGSDVVLGVVEEARYRDLKVSLEPGSVLLLYTDGVTEVFNPDGEEYGEDRLRRLVSEWEGGTAEELRDRILREVRGFSQGCPDYDDITMIVLRLR